MTAKHRLSHIAGAAYGLAGMVKGLGIISFKQHDIISKLTDAIQDKKNYRLACVTSQCFVSRRFFKPRIANLLLKVFA